MAPNTFALDSNQNVTLEMFLCETTASTSGPRPLVVVCPGGGFLACSPNEGAPVAHMFNRAGYHAAVLAYTTAQSAPGVSAYPRALLDLAETVVFVRTHAREWDVDPAGIVICGFSAGGWLCGMYENLWNSELFAEIATAEDRRPNAAILCYPLVDYQGQGMLDSDHASLMAVLGKGADVQMQVFKRAVNEALLGSRELGDELAAEVSPIRHIGPSTPPTFVWTTFGDGLLDPLQSLAYARRLHEANVTCELHVFQDGFHGLSLATEETAHNPAGINSHVAHWAGLACEWLDALL